MNPDNPAVRAFSEAIDTIDDLGLPYPDSYQVLTHHDYVSVIYSAPADTVGPNIPWTTSGIFPVYPVVSNGIEIRIIAGAMNDMKEVSTV